MKRIVNFVLLVVLSFVVVPNIVSADVKEIEGVTYSRVGIDYTMDNDDYLYVYGILSPTEYVIYNDDYDEFYYFKKDAYREGEATSAEIIKSREIMWYSGDENDYRYSEEYEIIKANNDYQADFSGNCYDFNTDLTAQDGVTYYLAGSGPDTIVPVIDFDEDKAYEYFVRKECVEDSVVSQLTSDQITILEALVEDITEENDEIYADKYNFSMRYFPILVGNEFINVFEIRYTNDNVDESQIDYYDYEYVYQFYDLEGNELAELEDYIYMIYLEKSNLIVAEDDTTTYILDTDFNVIFECEGRSYYYLFDIDDNRLLLDYEDGEAEMITRYVVLEGGNQTYDGKNLALRINGEVSLLDKVYVNDVELSTDNYVITEGSTIITLKDAYLKSLKNATYTLKATYTDGGTASTTFIVNAITNPKTNDNLLSILIIGSISLIGIISLLIVANKKRHN